MSNRERTLSREVEAVVVPYGNKITLAAGTSVSITHTLGGSFTGPIQRPQYQPPGYGFTPPPRPPITLPGKPNLLGRF